jgi:hypothetical protein
MEDLRLNYENFYLQLKLRGTQSSQYTVHANKSHFQIAFIAFYTDWNEYCCEFSRRKEIRFTEQDMLDIISIVRQLTKIREIVMGEVKPKSLTNKFKSLLWPKPLSNKIKSDDDW